MLFDKPLRDHPPLLQLLLLFSLCIASGGLFTLIALQFSAQLTGISGQLVPAWLDQPDIKYIPYIWWMQSMSAFGLMVVPGIIWAYYYDYTTSWEPLGLHFKTSRKSYLAVVGIMLVSMPIIYAVYHWNQGIALPAAWSELEASLQKAEKDSEQTIKLLMQATGWSGLLMNLFVIALLPAISEELIFRGVLQNIMRSLFKQPHLAIWLTAILFSAIHMQWYGFLPRMLLGALFGYFYFWSGKISLAVLAHLVNNGLAVIIEYTGNATNLPVDEDVLLASPWWLVLLSLLFSGIFLRYLYLHRRELNPISLTP